jgi:hypothetical protein
MEMELYMGQKKIPAYTGQLLVVKKYIYIFCKVSSGRVGPQDFKLDKGSGIL